MMRDIDELAREHGLVQYEKILPVHWLETMRQHFGEPPWGFVWSYDRSRFGEPYPLTEASRLYADQAGIKPR